MGATLYPMTGKPSFCACLASLTFVSVALFACSSSTSAPGTGTKDGGSADGATTTGPAVDAGLMSLIGEACGSDTDCVEGLKCAREDPNGQCYKECTVDADCGDVNLYACS